VHYTPISSSSAIPERPYEADLDSPSSGKIRGDLVLRKEHKFLNRVYYEIKPAIPRSLQITLRRLLIPLKARRQQGIWPINPRAGERPIAWKGWPQQRQFALAITHDVDTPKGEDRCLKLMEIDKNAGFRSAFYFVPGRVRKSASIIPELKKNGFEIGVHDLFHDGKLFRSKAIFQERAVIINRFLSKWEAVGFRAGAMHHNLDWMHHLDILYDTSTFDVDPFEPQPDGMTTIFPLVIECPVSGKRYVELPYTLPQDFMLFVIMRNKNTDIWKKKLDWIAAKGGMAMVITHPDYMNLEGKRLAIDEYRAELYGDFLAYVNHKYGNLFWHALPSEIAEYWTSSGSLSRAR